MQGLATFEGEATHNETAKLRICLVKVERCVRADPTIPGYTIKVDGESCEIWKQEGKMEEGSESAPSIELIREFCRQNFGY